MKSDKSQLGSAAGVCRSFSIRNKKVDSCISKYENKEVTQVNSISTVKPVILAHKSMEEEFPSGRENTCLSKLSQKAYYLPLVYCEFWISASYSLLMAFFPKLASSKCLEAWKFGLIFSSYKVAMFIATGVANRMMSFTSPMTCYLLGQCGTFLSSMLFGALFWIPEGNLFLGISLLAALGGGFSLGTYRISMYTIVTVRFVQDINIILAFLEFLYTSGSMAGTSLGGVLVDVWAYPLPFFGIGIIMMLSFPFLVRLRFQLDKGNGPIGAKRCSSDSAASHHKLLIDPIFLVNMITAMINWIMNAFNEATLEPSFRELDLTGTVTGTIFAIQHASAAVGSVISGLFSHYGAASFYAVVGQIYASIAFLLVGPVPFLPWERAPWMIYSSQVCIGLANATLFVCSYSHALSVARMHGYPDNVETKSFVSSSFFAFTFFGGIITPPIAGHLSESYGYRSATMIMFALMTAWIPVRMATWVWCSCVLRKRKSYDMDPVRDGLARY